VGVIRVLLGECVVCNVVGVVGVGYEGVRCVGVGQKTLLTFSSFGHLG
jgi:hypothetical protein